ncbi:MAG: biosynthetic arginine decarboxylase [bacterium]|nr:biosynthetic arginine decarboxylase [bacterium]
MRKWRTEDSSELYNVTGWGIGYYGINAKGNATVMPRKSKGPTIDVKELVDELILRDVSVPVLLRFPDILDDRIEKIAGCFVKASTEYDYTGKYYSVYPIKVNQQRPVLEEIVRHGKRFNIGLEAGSKPELHAVLAIMDNEEALIICNGYKDEEFIELALLAQKMGKRIYIVAEKLNELKLINAVAKRLKVRPNIGVRIKLAAAGSGKWEESGGDQSKFGLNASELLDAVEFARENDLLDCFRLIHFHLGSQITNIRKIKSGLREVAQFYVQLSQMGCDIDFVDIGGGLGVDYDGSRSAVASSINYSIQEYANDAISTLVDAATKNSLPHPNVITESGRALTAHHSVLVFNVLETTSMPVWTSKDRVTKKDHEIVRDMHSILGNMNSRNMLESWHDAQQMREEALDRFSLGLIDLKTRAQTEKLYWSIAHKAGDLTVDLKQVPEDFRQLQKLLADKYFCNFSLFQSLPDSWAIDQLFPIMPIHRLNERPSRLATIQDITCDSDGKIDHFIGVRDSSHSLPLHPFTDGEPYYLAVYLVGAYQEILGDLHNLFGDTNAVHVVVTEKGGYEIDKVIDGETVADVLDYVQFDAKKLVRTMEAWVSASVKEKRISVLEGKEFLAIYRSGLYGYTYLEE